MEKPFRTEVVDRIKDVLKKHAKKEKKVPKLMFIHPSPEARKKITECGRAS